MGNSIEKGNANRNYNRGYNDAVAKMKEIEEERKKEASMIRTVLRDDASSFATDVNRILEDGWQVLNSGVLLRKDDTLTFWALLINYGPKMEMGQ